MPHQAPAENNAATATRPIATLNPGRELLERERRCRNGKTRGGWSGVADSSFWERISDGISKGSSVTGRSDNSTRAAEMTIGCAKTACSGTSSGIEGAAGGACSVAEKIAVAGDGASSVSTPITLV